jgi:AcrR family transcriptional regulator
MTAPHEVARRSQADRTARTRERLLEATIASLVARGARGTTTAEIERRAGLSRGARLHHFRTKAELLGAAVEHLFLGLRVSFESAIQAALRADLDRAERFAESFRLLWSRFEDPRHAAVLELFLLARSDPELRARLREVTARHHAHMQRRARVYFPEAGPEVELLVPAILESIHAAMEGLALRRVVFGADATEKQVLDTVQRMTRSLIALAERTRETDHRGGAP